MANSLSITLGATTLSIPVKGTVAQVKAVLKRYAKSRDIKVEGRTDQEIGEDVLRAILLTIKDGSKSQQREEMYNAQLASFEQTIETDNDL